ncbi:MAG TPA: LLM class oxidoreductase [Dyella sp.]|uniref:LLM class oxidoreductase n=1 Tax=Dyella sp. TaxID=1869338 RepID=UPI002CF5E783|nr:LLM class oxidoreductase [Dyella sp.]HTV84833.1 LLM class oxidoreductase [Dyella sp.]
MNMHSRNNAASDSADLSRHPGFSRVFQPGKLTFGFIAPLEGYRRSPFPTLADHEALARQVDQAGFTSLWLRDVPFYDPGFGDVGQVLDPFVYLGFLASVTKRLTLGTAGIVAPLRDPVIVAKQAASVDQLSGGRLVLGMASGDRPIEYPAFGIEFDHRDERYRETFPIIRALTETSFPRFDWQHYGTLQGTIDMVPKPAAGRIPLIVIGRSRQTIEWIAHNADGWIWYVSDYQQIGKVVQAWRQAVGPGSFKPYGYGTFFDLSANPDAPIQVIHGVLTGGRHALIDLWKQQEALGVSHVALNLKPLQRPFAAVMEELAEYVLPAFPSHT